jgi:hypothetical protein
VHTDEHASAEQQSLEPCVPESDDREAPENTDHDGSGQQNRC